MKIFVFHLNAPQRVSSTQEDFNNHADKVTCFVNTTQPLCLAIHIIARWAPKQSGHSDREGDNT